MKKIIFKITITLIFTLITANVFAQQKKKLFIYDFDYSGKQKPEYKFFKKSLPRSVRSVLSKQNQANYSPKLKQRNALLKQGYDFYVKGRYSVKNGKMLATFSIIELKKYLSVIIVIARGYPDTRMFDLIDNVSSIVNETLEKSIDELIKKTVIVKISEKGRVTVVSKNLSGMDLKGMIFVGVNFQGMNLKGTDFSGSELRNCNFKNADLENAKFTDANIVGCDFLNADIKNADFNNVFFYEVKNFRKAKNMNQAEIAQSHFDYLYFPRFQLGITGNAGFAWQFFKYADYINGTSETKTGYTYNAGVRGIYYLTRNFGLMFDIGWEHLFLNELINPPAKPEYSEDFIIGNLYFNVYALLRYKRIMIYVGPYLSTTLYVNKPDTGKPFFSNFGINFGAGYLIPITPEFDILLSAEVRAFLLKRWYDESYGTIVTLSISASFLFTLK